MCRILRVFIAIVLGSITARIALAAQCPPGTYSRISDTQCEPCAAGRYSSAAGSSTCAACPSGSITPAGATACCPVDSHDWPVTHTVTLNLEAGRVWTHVYQVSGCEDSAVSNAALVEAAPASQASVNGSLRLATVIRGKEIHSCKSFLCPGAKCSLVAPDTEEHMPGLFLTINAFVEVSGANDLHQCVEQAQVGFSGFGCEEGTVLAFLGALVCVISGTIILGLIFEFLFRRHADFFVQASLKIMPARPENPANAEPLAALWPLPTLRDLHQDVHSALTHNLPLTGWALPVCHTHGWSERGGHGVEAKADAVGLQFRIPRRILPEVDALRKQLLGLSWLPGEGWATSNVVVESQPPACVREMGKLPGADLFDAIEGSVVKCLSCCSGRGPDLGDDQLYLLAARQVLATLMTRRMAIAIFIQNVANTVMIILLPAVAASTMTCEDGFPNGIHAVWGVYVLFSSLFGTWIIIRPLLYSNSKQLLTTFIKKFRLRILLRYLGMLVSVTDIYQDTSFPVIAGVCGFDLWWVSLWLVFLGVGVMQVLVQIILIFNCWRRYKRARTAEERERIHIEGIFLALRGCDNHVLVYAAKPAIEERLGGASSWAIKTVEARVAFLRFCFEDAEQSALQVIFLYWFENASIKDKLWVAFSVSTSLLLSFTLTVQTLPEVRDWIWYQFLTAFPGARLHRWRFVWLFVLVALYRLLSVLPWLGACTPAGDHDQSAFPRLLLLREVPPTVLITEVFGGCAIAFAVALFMTTVSACVWNKSLGLSRRWNQWRGTLPYGFRGVSGKPHDFNERLVADDQLHLKTEQDEDTWLTPLRAISAECAAGSPAKVKLEEIDAQTFELVRAAGLSNTIFSQRREQVVRSLKDLEGLGVSQEPFKALNVEVEHSMNCAAVRQRALELLADRTFRKASLSTKARLIDEATKGQLPLQIVHWSTIEKLKHLPRCNNGKEPGAITVAEAVKQCSEDRIVLIYFSHSWTRQNHPDSEMHIKARTLVQFAHWLRARAARHRLNCEVYFWVDYCCIDNEVGLEIGIAALPLFVAACTDFLTWRTPDYESRCWTMVERLLAYCFCPGGLTPYAVDGTSFGLERALHLKKDPTDTELEKDFGELYREITSPTKRAQTVPLDGGETEVQRFTRKLPDPLDSMALRPSGTPIAIARRRQMHQLVDMALAVPALEIFGDRQPVEFGLTEVVEQVIGNHVPLESGFGDDEKRPVMVAWKEPSEEPDEETGKWLMLKPAEVEVAEWRLVVELANSQQPKRHKSFNFRPGDDEGVLMLVDAGHPPGDEPPIAPRVDEIDALFAKVSMAHEDHLRSSDSSALEKAASDLAKALKADLRAALHAAEKNGDESALRQAITRTRTAELPEKKWALERLCEMQLSAASAAGDIVGIRMAMRYARHESLEDLPAYSAAEAALARLQVEKLRANALSVVHDDGADPHSIVSVVGVAKQRGWRDIAKEALAALEVRIKDAGGNINLDNLLAISSLGQTLSVDAVAAMTDSIAFSLLEDLKKRKIAIDIVKFIQKWRKWCLTQEVESEAVAALQSVIDHWKDNALEANFAAARSELQSICEAAKGGTLTEFGGASPDLDRMAATALLDINKVQESEQHRVRTSMIYYSSTPAPGKLSEAITIAKAWGWNNLAQEAETVFEQLVRSASKCKPQDAVPELCEIFNAATEHQLDGVIAACKTAFAGSLEEAKGAKDPIVLMQMLHNAQAKGGMEFAGKVRPVLWDVVAYFKESDLADAEETLFALTRAAQELGEGEIAELAGEAAGAAAAREEEKREEARSLLVAAPNLLSVVEVLGLASRRGWGDIVESAQEAARSKLSELSKPMTQEELTDLAQAFHLADQQHVHAGAHLILFALNSHKQQLMDSDDAAGILSMVCILQQEGCGKVAEPARQTLKDMMSDWCKAGHTAPWAPALRDAARAAGGSWLDLADQIDRKMKLTESLVQATRDKDLKLIGLLGRDALADGFTADYEEVLKFLNAEFESWKSAGLEDGPDFAVLRRLSEAAENCRARKLFHLLGKVETVANSLQSLRPKIVDYKRRGHTKGLSEDLIRVISAGEKLGVAHVASDAREMLKQLVKLLEQDVAEEYARSALQELHDVARRQKLDDVADLAVNAVGGNLPKDWLTNGSRRLSLLEKIASNDEELINRVQQLVDATYRGWGKLGADCSTRDRYKLGNPQGASLKVEQVIHVENAANYLNFIRRQSLVEDEFKALADKGRDPKIKTWQVSFAGLRRYPKDPVEKGMNECWLWHGTSEAGVNGITDTDFDMARAGKHVGTMFGRGIYFTESSLKADEYTKPDARGWSPMLLCRVTLGHYYYCDAKAPWDMTETLERACKTGGGYHSVLGDRERVRGTYREFVVFDNDQIYPEYIVWYSRNPPFKEGTVPK